MKATERGMDKADPETVTYENNNNNNKVDNSKKKEKKVNVSKV